MPPINNVKSSFMTISVFFIITTFFLPLLSRGQFSFQNVSNESSLKISLKSSGISLPSDTGYTLYMQGLTDAKEHYPAFSSFALSFGTSCLFPPAGLCVTIANSLIKPKEYNLFIPKENKYLILNDSYYNGYTSKAKKKKTWYSVGGFVTGTAFFISGLVMTGHIYDLYNKIK